MQVILALGHNSGPSMTTSQTFFFCKVNTHTHMHSHKSLIISAITGDLCVEQQAFVGFFLIEAAVNYLMQELSQPFESSEDISLSSLRYCSNFVYSCNTDTGVLGIGI